MTTAPSSFLLFLSLYMPLFSLKMISLTDIFFESFHRISSDCVGETQTQTAECRVQRENKTHNTTRPGEEGAPDASRWAHERQRGTGSQARFPPTGSPPLGETTSK
jgi:hypothetical protein